MRTLHFILFLFIGFNLVGQRPGDLYPLFGDEGIFIENWKDTSSNANGLGILSNGNVIVGGSYRVNDIDSSKIFALKLDEYGDQLHFGNFSRGFRYWFDSHNHARSLAVLPGNSILLAGRYSIEHVGSYPYVIKLLENGQIDNSFADEGIFCGTSIQMDVRNIRIIEYDDSYLIILCGSMIFPRLLMIDEDGSVVSDFGTDGLAELTDYRGHFNDIAFDRENHLYACGRFSDGTTGPVVAKFNLSDGTLSEEFGTDGILHYTTGLIANCDYKAIVYDETDSTIALFGDYFDEDWDTDIFAHRVSAIDGSTDLGFGVNGWSSIQSDQTGDYIESALLQSDGKYYFGGSIYYEGNYDILLGRINHNGFADTTFGYHGLVINDFGYLEEINTIALSPSESILYASGYMEYPDSNSILVTAYYTGHVKEEPERTDTKKQGKINLYPNPSKDFVTLKMGCNGSYQVSIFDLTGKELISKSFTGENCMLDLEMLLPSVYFLKIIAPDGQITIQKLVKNN